MPTAASSLQDRRARSVAFERTGRPACCCCPCLLLLAARVALRRRAASRRASGAPPSSCRRRRSRLPPSREARSRRPPPAGWRRRRAARPARPPRGPARPATGAPALLAGKQPSDTAGLPAGCWRTPAAATLSPPFSCLCLATERESNDRFDDGSRGARPSHDDDAGLCWALHRPGARSSSARHPARRSLLLLLRACPLPTGDGTSGRSTASSSRQTSSGGTERRWTCRRRCSHAPGRARKKSSECRRRRARSPGKRAAAGASDPSSGG